MSRVSTRAVSGGSDSVTKILDIVYLSAVALGPVVLLQGAFSQDLLKATLLVVPTMMILGLRSYRFLISGLIQRGPTQLAWATVAFSSALVLTSALSSQPWVAFTGAPVRGIGAVTYLACLVLCHGIFRDFKKRSVEPLIVALLGAGLLVVGVALIEAYGTDPFGWSAQMSFAGLIASTLGNPNFSSGFVAITLPLLVRCQFHPTFRPAVRVASGASVGASMAAIALMDSLQSQLAALVGLLVLGVWWLQRPVRHRMEALAHLAPTGAVILLAPIVLKSWIPRPPARFGDAPVYLSVMGFGSVTILTLSVGLAACTLATIWREPWWTLEADRTPPQQRSRKRRARFVTVLCLATLGSVAAAVLLVADQFRGGLVHRREMWQVGVRILGDNPIFGTGLETYYSYFSRLRPLEHAVGYEDQVSDNIHSVPLGMFSGGGVVLGCSYLALLAVVAFYGIRALRRTRGAEQLTVGAVFAAWLAYQVQSVVSVDVSGLAHSQWILAGILLAIGAADGIRVVAVPGTGVGAIRRTRRRRRGAEMTSSRRVLVALGLGFGLLVAVGPVTAPLRASFAYRSSHEVYLQGDLPESISELVRATELEPRNGGYAETLGQLYAEAGDLESALVQFEKAARLRPGVAPGERLAGRINRDLGHVEQAVMWHEKALASEPYGPRNLREVAGFYRSIGEEGRMQDFLADYESRNLDLLFPAIADAYETLGDSQNAKRMHDLG